MVALNKCYGTILKKILNVKISIWIMKNLDLIVSVLFTAVPDSNNIVFQYMIIFDEGGYSQIKIEAPMRFSS